MNEEKAVTTADGGQEGIFASSGNVFADLGLSNADDLLVKAKLAHEIRKRIQGYGLTQTQAADVLGTTQARVSDVTNGKIAKMSYDLLLGYLSALECDIKILLSPRHAAGRAKTDDPQEYTYERGQIMVAAG